MNESIKSKYKPQNPRKYKGNPNNIVCRSNWEKKFCQWCDTNENILLWASEEFSIPYVSPLDRRVHQYYPDFLIKVQEGGGAIRDYVIEVKPKRQCIPPKRKSKVTKSYIYEAKTYEVNKAKWRAAEDWCKDRRLIFKVITEDELGIKYKK
tara:strand:+ start:1511 stop:1963 length:453 start_codon:yes stop_codon:yes gene_type:complete